MEWLRLVAVGWNAIWLYERVAPMVPDAKAAFGLDKVRSNTSRAASAAILVLGAAHARGGKVTDKSGNSDGLARRSHRLGHSDKRRLAGRRELRVPLEWQWVDGLQP